MHSFRHLFGILAIMLLSSSFLYPQVLSSLGEAYREKSAVRHPLASKMSEAVLAKRAIEAMNTEVRAVLAKRYARGEYAIKEEKARRAGAGRPASEGYAGRAAGRAGPTAAESGTKIAEREAKTDVEPKSAAKVLRDLEERERLLQRRERALTEVQNKLKEREEALSGKEERVNTILTAQVQKNEAAAFSARIVAILGFLGLIAGAIQMFIYIVSGARVVHVVVKNHRHVLKPN